ncbi:hypothetical protein N7504_000952 [Penicillium tannophilum]|nr:hypothetical protein N7504_000952 [Penicillium tannophilum]
MVQDSVAPYLFGLTVMTELCWLPKRLLFAYKYQNPNRDTMLRTFFVDVPIAKETFLNNNGWHGKPTHAIYVEKEIQGH